VYKKALIILSGGLDSATCLALAKSNGYDCTAITFDYGQRLIQEIDCAKKLCEIYSTKFELIKSPIGNFKSSSLTDLTKEIPLDYNEDEVPTTYVPARNTVFLSIALAYAEANNIFDIFIGVNVIDYSGYPDCRPEFINAFEKMANLGTKSDSQGRSYKIHTPLIKMNKAEIIKNGVDLGLNYKYTLSCYQPKNNQSCGKCSSCVQRLAGFLEAGVKDPINYV
jgi:7-cyano-7-deazaguanine synthase